MNIRSRKHIASLRQVTMIMLSLFFTATLQAEEPVNVTTFEGCQAITRDKARLVCYDTIAKGEIYNEEKREQLRVEEFGAEKMRKPSEEKPAPVQQHLAPHRPDRLLVRVTCWR